MKKQLVLILLLLLLGGCSRRAEPAAVLPDEAESEAPAVTAAPQTTVVLSELVAANRTAYAGDEGLFPDYLVLRNEGSESVSIEGWQLSQKAGRKGYALPAVTLGGGESVTIACDGWGRGLHSDFALKSSGESVVLSDAEGNVFWQLDYPALGEDEAYVRTADGSYAIRDASASCAALPEGLYISECAPFNSTFYPIAGEYYDWVELYNGSSRSVNLAGYTLSDKRDPEKAIALPEYHLKSGENVVILCTGGDTGPSEWPLHPISLSGERDSLYLHNAGGELLDYCSLHDVQLYGSYGRQGSDWVWFPEATPGKPNGEGFREISGPVSVDVAEGCYENVDRLCLSLSGSGEIRYTLDGSEPGADSPLYTSPLTIESTSVLRARSFEADKLPGKVSGWSYILNEGHSLPVVSLILDPVKFFATRVRGWQGIYYLPANTVEPELLTDVSFFDGEEGFHAQSTISLHGASTRKSREKKSLKLTFRGIYGGDVHYDLFGDGEERFHSLTVRSGYMADNTLLRDSICQSTAIDTGAQVLPLRNRYCIVYINGEYWGIYSLREAYSKAYAADHLQSSEDAVQIVRSRVRKEFKTDLVAFFNYLSNHRVWTQKEYDKVAEKFDLVSLADWMVLETYFYNYDLPGNIRYIRADENSKYQYAFFDLDFALRKDGLDWSYTLTDGQQFGLITSHIVDFPAFQSLLLERMALLFSQGLDQETMLSYLDRYTAELSPELEREYARWEQGKAGTDAMLAELREQITDHRQSRCFESLCKWLHLDAESLRAQYFGDRELE